MWPFGQKKNEVVTISLSPQNITCSHIRKSKEKKELPVLHAYRRIPLKHLEFAQAIPFNHTLLLDKINRFINDHNLQNADVVLAFSGPKIFEKIITLQNSAPSKSDFDLPELKNLTWNFLYLCPSQRNGFDFFVCGMQPEHLFSYQLLALSCAATVTTITTGKFAHLHLYKHTKGSMFRQSELSLDLLHQRYDVNALIPAELIKKTIQLHKDTHIDSELEYTFLKESLGLFLSESAV